MSMRRCTWLPVMALTLALACPATGTANTIRVESGESIQDAVNSASSGDTVLVAAGDYSGAGNQGIAILEKSLVVIAEDGPEATTISLSSANRAFRIEGTGAESVTIRGFTISDGSSYRGGAVFVTSAALELSQCYIHNCVATAFYDPGYGGGLCVWSGAEAHVSACTFAANTAEPSYPNPGFGTSVYTYGSSTTVIERCLFMDDWGSFTAGVLFSGGSGTAIRVYQCIFFGAENIGWAWLGFGYLEADPYVCGSGNEFKYAPCNDSLCLPGYNPWGAFIGALQLNCGPCSSSVETMSWGAIKALYRDPR